MNDVVSKILTANHSSLGWLVITMLVVGLLFNKLAYFILPFKKLFLAIFPPKNPIVDGDYPSAMVIVPSLLRDEYDLKEIIGAVHSCAINGYSGELHIIASADGRTENVQSFNDLVRWLSSQKYAPNIRLHVASNEVRRGKMMAIYAAVTYMQGLVKSGELSELPKVYFSFDADETVDQGSLQKLVERLMRPHWLTGRLRKVAVGQICVNSGDMWKGWRSLFTIAGHSYLWVAKGFFTFGAMLENINPTPYPILPGPLYVTWSDVIVTAPRFMGYLQTLTILDWIKWWVGIGLPKFSDYAGELLPEALCGNTDDSSISTFITMGHWSRNGKLSWDMPHTPFHAFGRLLYDFFIERAQTYEPLAKGYIFTPPRLKSLWHQRRRWMACRVEVNGRFFRGFLFYWSAAWAFYGNFSQAFIPVLQSVLFFLVLPYSLIVSGSSVTSSFIMSFILSYLLGIFTTLVVWLFEPKRNQFIHVLLASLLPTMWIFGMVFVILVMFVGVFQDVVLFGCNVLFYPSRTLIASRAQRIAISYRVRRLLKLCWRSIRYGDIPLKWSWIGWYEDKELGLTNGFTGWTKDSKSDYILR